MSEGGVFGRVIALIFLSLLTIASFIVLYHLFTGFYCPKPVAINRKKPKHTNAASEIHSKSNEMSQSQPVSDVDNSAKPQPIISFFKRNTIAACVLFSIICVVCAMDQVHLLSNPGRESDMFLLLSLPLYFMGRILLSLIFIGRLHFTFKGSTFEYGKCTMNSLKGAWCTMVFSALLSILLSMPSPFRSELFGMVVGVLFILIDIALLFILLYLYGKKLYVLMVSGDDYFLTIMTKYSWLYTVCFMSTFLVILGFVLQLISFAVFGDSWFGGEDIVIFIAIDALSNCLCLWLNMRTANHWYYVLCGWCDKQCGKCCQSWTNNAPQSAKMMKDVVVSSRDDHPSPSSISNEMNIKVESEVTGNQAIVL